MEGREFQRIAGVQRLLLLLQHIAYMDGLHRMGEAQPGAAIAPRRFIQPQDIRPLGILAGLYGFNDHIGLIHRDQRRGLKAVRPSRIRLWP